MARTGADVFDSGAATYEEQRRRLIPQYEAFYGGAVAALDLAGRPVRRVLDLGAGTGLLARQIAAAHPGVALTLLDAAPAMLEQARRVLGSGARYVTQDLTAQLPRGPWDAVVSALAIHHLDDERKRELFARVHAELAPGAVFVNAEQVAGPTDFFDDAYARWHERTSAQLGASAQEWADARERMALDRCASVERQLAWLEEAGFSDADCLFKHHRFAVLVARRADAAAKKAPNVRRATIDDARTVAQVQVASWRAAYRGLLADERLAALSVDEKERDWVGLLGAAGSGQQTLVAQDAGGLVVGFSALRIPSRDDDARPETGEIAAFYVDPAAWRGGIGRALIARSLDELRAGRCNEVTVWVIAANSPALEFYARFGFAADGSHRRLDGVLDDRLRLALGRGTLGSASPS